MGDDRPGEEPSWLDERCPITWTTFREIGPSNMMVLPCFHKFERDAIVQHLRNGNEFCPVCKIAVKAEQFGIEVERPDPGESDDEEEEWLESERDYDDGSDDSLGGFIVPDNERDEDFQPEGADDDDDDPEEHQNPERTQDFSSSDDEEEEETTDTGEWLEDDSDGDDGEWTESGTTSKRLGK
jgi:hypothetical protein